ncbi:hypothetical protein BH09BAC5_BH09BAC5_24040 [soil metagenome]
MKKYFLFLITTFFFLNIQAAKFIRQDGNVIRDSTGKTVRLNGVNLGGWMLWEGWIWGGGFTSETKIQTNLELLAGKQMADSFRLNIYSNFITEADIKAISETGLNVVRIPVNHKALQEGFQTMNGKLVGWEILDNVIGWCKKYQVYVVIDMHGAPAGQSSYFIADPDKPNLWKNQNAKNQTIALWKQIATRYANETIIAGYDLLNEPVPSPKDSLVSLYEKIISAIRSVDSNHMMIIEGGNFAKDFSMFKKLPDNNMLFSFHMYTWLGGDPTDKIKDFVALSEKFNVPIWCGEWGENSYEVLEKTLKTFSDTANKLSGWCFWTWKKVLNNYPALNAINCTASWKEIIKWCSTPSTKHMPGHDVAVAAMKEFELAIVYDKTTHDGRLTKLLSDYAKLK